MRVEYAGAVYHITTRGNERKNIFKHDADRELFLDILQQTISRFHWVCHGYVLMSNHFHLLIETPEPNLSRGMRQLNGRFTQEINRIHRRVGHLFQGRFKAILIEKEEYLLEVSRYIVLNPVRAGMVHRPDEWKWSSYLATAGLQRKPSFLTAEWIKTQFGKSDAVAERAYEEYIMQGVGKKYPQEALTGQIILGTKRFIRQIEKRVNEKAWIREFPKEQRYSARADLEEIFQEGTRNRESREVIIFRAYVDGGYTMREIAEYLGLHYSSVSLAIKRYEKLAGKTL
jgi:REP element-mobilizing transposase RayT